MTQDTDSQAAHKLSFDYTTTDTIWRINDLIYGGRPPATAMTPMTG